MRLERRVARVRLLGSSMKGPFALLSARTVPTSWTRMSLSSALSADPLSASAAHVEVWGVLTSVGMSNRVGPTAASCCGWSRARREEGDNAPLTEKGGASAPRDTIATARSAGLGAAARLGRRAPARQATHHANVGDGRRAHRRPLPRCAGGRCGCRRNGERRLGGGRERQPPSRQDRRRRGREVGVALGVRGHHDLLVRGGLALVDDHGLTTTRYFR